MKRKLRFFATRLFVFIALIGLQAWVIVALLFALSSVSQVAYAIMYAAGLFLVLWIANKRQNPGYKIAWIILILVLPVFGMTMYFFFSQRQLSKKAIYKGIELYRDSRNLILPDTKALEDIRALDEDAARQSDYIVNLSAYPAYTNTQTKYYATGEDFFHDLRKDLRKAEKCIFMEFFIVQGGVMWDTVLQILEEKAAQGVDVRVMYDDIGCLPRLPNKYYLQLREKGIQCQAFNPLTPALNSMFNNRNHRKIVVIDGNIAYTGGANLADEYINAIERFGLWKDAMIRLQGEGAYSMMIMFLHLWALTDRENKGFSAYLPVGVEKTTATADGFVQPYADYPFDEDNISEGVFLNMITRAKDYIYINTPYLVLTNELVTALTNAAQSGVDVRITVPHIPDKKMVFMLTRSYYDMLIQEGVRVYEYTPGFIHSKTFLCDDKFGIVGAVNMDYRSLYLHFECGVWLFGCPCLSEMKQDYEKTMLESKEIMLAETRYDQWYKRLFVAILHIFGPLM